MSLLYTYSDRTPEEIIENAHGNNLLLKGGECVKDFSGGITGHNTIGWGVHEVAKAGYEQLKKIGHMDYKNYLDENRQRIADILIRYSMGALSNVYFVGGSGGEACEASIKLSYQVHLEEGNSGKQIYLGRKQSYHGMSSDNLSMGDRPNLEIYSFMHPKQRYLVDEHNYYRHGRVGESRKDYTKRSLTNLRTKIEEIGPERIGGFVGETMMGGLVGDVPPEIGYWQGVKDICREFNIHLILDEVWCGCGVSGSYYCFTQDNVEPDFVFMGKTLASGYAPISVVCMSKKMADVLEGIQIQHSTTFQGHSVCAAIALSVLEYIDSRSLVTNAKDLGEKMRIEINNKFGSMKYFKNVRGRGVRTSIEIDAPNAHIFNITLAKKMRQKGFLISAKWHRISILPTMSNEMRDLEEILDVMHGVWESQCIEWDESIKYVMGGMQYF